MIKALSIQTSGQVSFVDITDQVSQLVSANGAEEGLCIVYSPHTTCGITINENADPDVRHDMIHELSQVVPFEDGYQHTEGNSAAHIKASLMGSSVQIPVSRGTLLLGTWQGIYVCEFDGPRKRHITVQMLS
ncbi:MAG: secondary thiamine-phosphate synthase enzyme YjbQ [Spirochaetia bacterium]|nr:secondary thiamine-phosphate synthase enzyme YjbQ [Spirochaetia bacterium]MCF7940297.1 secondary thiamine-phosphate synthase enzyme YjbQ [Spirochaetia bacterium]